MKNFITEDIRNVVFAGGGGAGKTTLAEALLFIAGSTTRQGSTDEGNSLLDWDQDEIARKTSLSASIASFEWKKKKINLIDTPGFANFLSDTYAAIRVADAAVIVISAVDGIKVETEKVFKQADLYHLPRFIFVSKVDKDRADFGRIVDSVNKFYEHKAVPVMIPVGEGTTFKGILDLVHNKFLAPGPDGKWTSTEPGEDERELAAPWREKMIEAVAETRDDLLEKYLETGTVEPSEMAGALSSAIRDGLLFPVFCGASLTGGGATQLGDAIVNYFPNPRERGAAAGRKADGTDDSREPDPKAPFSALVFKTVADPFAGRLTIFRVYSGTLHTDTQFYNASKDTRERIGHTFSLLGKTQQNVSEVVAGDIGGVAKLKETTTGDTLSDEKNPILYEFATLPKAAFSYAIEPKTKGDDDKVSQALHRLQEEDPSLQMGRDPQTREMILSGLGQMHLEVVIARLKRKFGVEVVMHEPKIAYKETIRGRAKVQGRHKKQTGGRGQFGDCWLEIEPLPRGAGFEFVDKIVGGSIPRNFIPAVEKGIVESKDSGPLAGYPVVDFRVSVYDGSYHTVDSSEMAFKIAARKGFKKGILESKPVLLEPIMKVDIAVPDEYMGDIIGNLNSRRGRVLGVDAGPTGQVIKATVPLAEMLKYSADLRSMTQGRGAFDMEFDHYEEVPSLIAEKVIALHKLEEEEEEE
jgi:elongation factor G